MRIFEGLWVVEYVEPAAINQGTFLNIDTSNSDIFCSSLSERVDNRTDHSGCLVDNTVNIG